MSNKVATVAETEQGTPSYYGGTITVKGRDLITSLLAGETIEFTRIVVGAGAMPEGVEPIDMEALVDPVADATSTIPVVENGEMRMTVEYRNDMNGGLQKGFWLREFGIFARTANSEEVLLYYATLGNSPQPVNAYQDNRIDIRRYPVTIALAIDADVQVTYNPGSFITSAEAQEMIGGMLQTAIRDVNSTILMPITIPAEGWKEPEAGEETGTEVDDYPLSLDVPIEIAKADHFPSIGLDKPSLKIAKAIELCPSVESLDGYLRFWAKSAPAGDMYGTLALIRTIGGSDGDGSAYVLPVANSTTLGGVKVQEGSGLTIDREGNIAVDYASDEEVSDAIDQVLGDVPEYEPPESGGDNPSTGDVATDDEVKDMISDVFGI